jgi:hypothetical protein
MSWGSKNDSRRDAEAQRRGGFGGREAAEVYRDRNRNLSDLQPRRDAPELGMQENQSGMLTSLGGKAFFRPVRGLGSSMAEQLTLNQLVLGSSPSRGTNFRCA